MQIVIISEKGRSKRGKVKLPEMTWSNESRGARIFWVIPEAIINHYSSTTVITVLL